MARGKRKLLPVLKLVLNCGHNNEMYCLFSFCRLMIDLPGNVMLLQMWGLIWILVLGSCLGGEGKWDPALICAPLLSLGNVRVQIIFVSFCLHNLLATAICWSRPNNVSMREPRLHTYSALSGSSYILEGNRSTKVGSQVPCSVCKAVSFKMSGLPWQSHSLVGIKAAKTTESYSVFPSVCQVTNINCNIGPYPSSHNALAYFFIPRIWVEWEGYLESHLSEKLSCYN